MKRQAVGKVLQGALHSVQLSDPGSVYDQVLREVSERTEMERSIGKAGIGALVVWKRIDARTTWANSLMLMPEGDLREITSRAYALAVDESVPTPVAGLAAREVLFDVPGLTRKSTGALASAVLLAMSPTRMAVWDRWVGTALATLKMRPKPGSGFYGRYLEVALELAEIMRDVSTSDELIFPRHVDLALMHAGRNPEMRAQLERAAS